MEPSLSGSLQVRRRILAMQCEVCKAMAHPLRLEIVERLGARELPAAALLAELGISKASLSKHMALLVQAGLAEQRRQGRKVFYLLSHPDIQRACAIMRAVLYRRLERDRKLARALKSPRAR